MSTYTKYVVNVKENLSRIRNPGNADDGICEQRVIFSNPHNIYNGTFIGEISCVGYHFTNVTIDGESFINNAQLDGGVTIKSGNEIVLLSDVLWSISDLYESISSSTSSLIDIINDVSSGILSITLSNDNVLCSMTLDVSSLVGSLSSFVSSDVVPAIESLSSTDTSIMLSIDEFKNTMTSAAEDISKAQEDIDFLSATLSTEIEERLSSFNLLSDGMSFMSSQVDTLSGIVLSNDEYLSDQISTLSNLTLSNDEFLSSQISVLSDLALSNDKKFSDSIDVLSTNVDDLWKNVRGGLNFMGVLTANAASESKSLSNFLQDNFIYIYGISPDEAASVKVRAGFFYPIHTDVASVHYVVDGIELEHGDWLIAKENFIVSSCVPSCMTVFDAQDADNAKLGDDNAFTGSNTFLNISAASMSCELTDFIYDSSGSTLFDLSADVYSRLDSIDDRDGEIEDSIKDISDVVSMKSYLGSADPGSGIVQRLSGFFTSITGIDQNTQLYRGTWARSADMLGNVYGSTDDTSSFIGKNDYLVVNKDIVVSSINWSDVDVICDPKNEAIEISNDLSSLSNELNEVSSFLNGKIDDVDLSVRQLSNEVSSLSFQCMHYYGDLSGSDPTLSGLLIHTYGELKIPGIYAGSAHRVELSIEVPDANGDIVKLYKNDYIIFKHDVLDIQQVTLDDFDIIRDAMTECLALSAKMTDNDEYLSSQISSLSNLVLSNDEYLSSQISSLSNLTLSNDEYLSNQISALSDEMLSNDESLSTAIDRKIFIDGISAESLCAIHISQDDFYQKVALSLDTIKDNELYIVSGNYINAYGQQMKNLSAPTDLSDAATKEYVDQISSTLSDQIQNLSTDLSTEISALTRNLYDQLQHIAEDEIISSLNQKSCISNVICAVVGIKDTLISLRETLSGMLGL